MATNHHYKKPIQKTIKKAIAFGFARDECKSNVGEYSGARYKMLETEKEVQQFVLQTDRAVVYTDGSCLNNGKPDAKAGIGVYWGDNHPDNVSERLQGRQTNQRAEIMAAIVALEKGREKGLTKIALFTDSEYTIYCITDWIDTWKVNGWKTANNKDVVNKKDVERLDSVCQEIDVEWIRVPAHSNIRGNEEADRLATSGAML